MADGHEDESSRRQLRTGGEELTGTLRTLLSRRPFRTSPDDGSNRRPTEVEHVTRRPHTGTTRWATGEVIQGISTTPSGGARSSSRSRTWSRQRLRLLA